MMEGGLAAMVVFLGELKERRGTTKADINHG